MSRTSASGRGSTGVPQSEVSQLLGIVVESSGTEVSIHNAWLHQHMKWDIVRWEKRDAYNNALMPGDWVMMVWRGNVVTKVTRYTEASPMQVRVCGYDVLVLAALSLKEPDAGKHEKQLWHEEFHSVGLVPYANTKDMRVGGGTKDMWIVWMKNRAERDKHLQRTGYDVLWKVAMDQGEQIFPNGQQGQVNWTRDSGIASQMTPLPSESSAESEESKTERTRKRGSYPGKHFNRVGVISGHKMGTPTYYVWTPGAPPMMEGRIIVHKVNGQEQIHVCDWIRFRVSKSDEETVFMNRDENTRFEVLDWEHADPYFPTQLSPNKQTIEIAVSKMSMTSENTKLRNGELFFEDDDFGWIGDRNSHFLHEYPLKEGFVIEFEGVIRRVKPRFATDSAWMILSRQVTYKGIRETKKNEMRPEREERRGSNERVERRDEYGHNGREEYQSNGRQERREHYLMQPPRFMEKRAGEDIESTAFVEGMGADGAAFLWLVDAAASGVVNGGAREMQLGQVVYGKFRKQNNGKWRALGQLSEGVLPGDMDIHVKRDKVYVASQIIFDAEQRVFRNPWFDIVLDMEQRGPRDPVDKEVFEVELVKMRSGFNINKLTY
ncbi:hypothetical protein PMAYCL1PPCAC_18593 [Pristionchus mayeri]|uniref:PRELI/MSF1 domain-containing protein n=1 Tax=Pristionchus mayeri TaxID=1317129 RepID=A0AAN5CPW4_9BILA|nr:hypothetical protein PMAYCL1PPCAC_18593 [Pristionchus mayeri]